MAEYQARKESVVQGIVDGIVEGFQLKAGNAEQRPGNRLAAQNKPFKSPKSVQPDQILHKGECFVIPGAHSADQVLANMDDIWCEEMTGNDGNSIQAGPLTKCDKNGKKIKSQVFSVGDHRECDKKFKVLAVDEPINSVQANIEGCKIWLCAGPLREV